VVLGPRSLALKKIAELSEELSLSTTELRLVLLIVWHTGRTGLVGICDTVLSCLASIMLLKAGLASIRCNQTQRWSARCGQRAQVQN
jgi:hypothetical protein